MNKMKTKTKAYSSPLIKEIISKRNPKEYNKTKRNMLLAKKIADAMEYKGWSRKQFAEMLDKNPSEITKWLSGTHNFTLDTLCKIESILDLTLFEIPIEV